MTEYIMEPTIGDYGFEYEKHEEVVRCRDCKHFMSGDLCKLQDEWNEFHWLQVEPDGFCAWGERRDA